MKTSRFAQILVAAAASAMLLFPAVASVSGQEDAQLSSALACSSDFGNPVQLDKSAFHLAPVPAAGIARLKPLKPALSAGPFAGGKFPYDKVDLFVAEKDRGKDDPEESDVAIYVRAVRNEKESWFTIAHDQTDVPGFDFLTRTKGDLGPEVGPDRDNDPGPSVSVALKNNNVPIFELSWWQHEVGASTFAAVQKLLLLDFRTLHPSVLAVLQCVAAEGGGVCGVYDNGNAPTTNLSCDWDATKSDFLCTSARSGDFTPSVSHRFYLASGSDAPYTVKGDDPPTLNAVAAWSTYNGLTNKTPDVPGLGVVTVLGRFAPDGARETAIVLASRGRDSDEPRYFAVIVDTQGPSAAFEILPQPLLDEPQAALSTTEVPSSPDTRSSVVPALINAADRFTDDVAPALQVQALETLPYVSMWQVTAKQGTFHEIVWLAVGFNSGTGRYVISAVRIASEFGSYAQCGRTRAEPFAASIDRKAGTLDAILDVEPAHQYTQDGELDDPTDQDQPVTPCPVKVRVFWNASIGFVRELSTPHCPAAIVARSMSISDAGVITTKRDDSHAE